MQSRFLAVIPAYNEAASIGELVVRASRYADVCVVDDASTDGTAEIALATGRAHCIRHATNTHIAGGILDGLRFAVAEIIPSASPWTPESHDRSSFRASRSTPTRTW
jgi:glycosyltransferase involved in cell wall biosynthesis